MRLLAVLLLCVVGLSQATLPPSLPPDAVPHDAYIWQRHWTPTVIAAARNAADMVRAWRVLTAQSDHAGRWTRVAVPWDALGATGRPIIAVVRIDGQLDEARLPALLEQAARVPASVVGIEIDYDCPTSKLAAYATFLAELRRRLPAAVALSITALPTWLSSPDLDKLATDLSEVVLQVHAVDAPRRGLFEPDRAEQWVRAFDRRIGRPFRVALPTYDVRVSWRPDGRLASVEGEMPLGRSGAENATLAADPEAVSNFLQAIERRAPQNFVGLAWFRLPTDADRRAWSLATWRAVVSGRLQREPIAARLEPTDSAGLWTVTLSNDGAVDERIPHEVRLDASCVLADGANGFHLRTDGDATLVLRSSGEGRLNAYDRRVIGWARCAEPRRPLHVVQ